jgi:hypothetical protein
MNVEAERFINEVLGVEIIIIIIITKTITILIIIIIEIIKTIIQIHKIINRNIGNNEIKTIIITILIDNIFNN